MTALANVRELLVYTYFDQETAISLQDIRPISFISKGRSRRQGRISCQPVWQKHFKYPRNLNDFPQGTIVGGTEGLSMFLQKFACACRCSDMISRFGKPFPENSIVPMYLPSW